MHRAQNSRSIVSPVCSSRGVTSQNIGCVWVSGFRASGLGAEFRGVQGTRTHSAHGRSACLKLPLKPPKAQAPALASPTRLSESRIPCPFRRPPPLSGLHANFDWPGPEHLRVRLEGSASSVGSSGSRKSKSCPRGPDHGESDPCLPQTEPRKWTCVQSCSLSPALFVVCGGVLEAWGFGERVVGFKTCQCALSSRRLHHS